MIIPVITGPTGVGKTRISVEIAKTIGCEIISCDSRQIYKELNIATAKPSRRQLEEVPHHFIDELTLEEPYSAGIFARRAEQRIEELLKKGVFPFIVGGSTLYLHALVHGLADIPQIDASVRGRLNDRLMAEGASRLFRELSEVDPSFAATLDPTKSQRIVRGLEVFYGTGQALSSFHSNQPLPAYKYRLFILERDREELYGRINARVDLMMEEGLPQEAFTLLKQFDVSRVPVLQTIGYQEFAENVVNATESGDVSELIKRNSRRYAKRQITWLGRYADAVRIDLSRAEPGEATKTITERINSDITGAEH